MERDNSYDVRSGLEFDASTRTLIIKATSAQLDALAWSLSMKAKYPEIFHTVYTGISDIKIDIKNVEYM